MYIAEIQARTWMYSGPYGYGDMDMLGIPLPPSASLPRSSLSVRIISYAWSVRFVADTNSRGRKRRLNNRRTKNSFQFMGFIKKSPFNRNSRTPLPLFLSYK